VTSPAGPAPDDPTPHPGDGRSRPAGSEPSTESTRPAPGTPWWGVGAAAIQCEGAAPRSDWAGWEADGLVPRSGDGNGFRTNHADDLALFAGHGLRRYRLTVEWARVQPAEDRWDGTELDRLTRLADDARAAGIELWVCLLHGSAPGWFTDDARGWLDDQAATLLWPRYVDRVAAAIGDHVAGWLPIHEPEQLAALGYRDGTFPPGRHDDDDHRDALATLRAAEAEAARLLRTGAAPVAVTARVDEQADGTGDGGGDDLLVVSAPVDRIDGRLEPVAQRFGDRGIVVVTGDPTTADDERREANLRRAAVAVAGAHDGGIDVRGAFHLPAVDGYEWHRGFDARLGLFDRDRRARPALAALGLDRGG
jgi:beta-glucosidase